MEIGKFICEILQNSFFYFQYLLKLNKNFQAIDVIKYETKQLSAPPPSEQCPVWSGRGSSLPSLPSPGVRYRHPQSCSPWRHSWAPSDLVCSSALATSFSRMLILGLGSDRGARVRSSRGDQGLPDSPKGCSPFSAWPGAGTWCWPRGWGRGRPLCSRRLIAWGSSAGPHIRPTVVTDW